MRIYLTGFMASGKSTVGPKVAEELEYAFVDLDEAIETRAGRSIPQIFEAEGEAAFRQQEEGALRATATREDVVVALGGGALASTHNLAFAQEHGTIVYLRVSTAELARRLMQSGNDRPLMQDEDGRLLAATDLRDRIESMLAARRAFYEEAEIVIDADQPVHDVVRRIVQAVQAHPDLQSRDG